MIAGPDGMSYMKLNINPKNEPIKVNNIEYNVIVLYVLQKHETVIGGIVSKDTNNIMPTSFIVNTIVMAMTTNIIDSTIVVGMFCVREKSRSKATFINTL